MDLDSPIRSLILSTHEPSLLMTSLMSAVRETLVSSLEMSSHDIFLDSGFLRRGQGSDYCNICSHVNLKGHVGKGTNGSLVLGLDQN